MHVSCNSLAIQRRPRVEVRKRKTRGNPAGSSQAASFNLEALGATPSSAPAQGSQLNSFLPIVSLGGGGGLFACVFSLLLLLFGDHPLSCLVQTPGFAFRNRFWQCSGDSMYYQGIKPGQLLAR